MASFYCIEAISRDREDWEAFLGHHSGLLAPGGTKLLAAMRRCKAYKVLGRVFPATSIDEDDFARLLPRLGFAERKTVICAVPVAAWAEEGFDSICLVAGQKAR